MAEGLPIELISLKKRLGIIYKARSMEEAKLEPDGYSDRIKRGFNKSFIKEHAKKELSSTLIKYCVGIDPFLHPISLIGEDMETEEGKDLYEGFTYKALVQTKVTKGFFRRTTVQVPLKTKEIIKNGEEEEAYLLEYTIRTKGMDSAGRPSTVIYILVGSKSNVSRLVGYIKKKPNLARRFFISFFPIWERKIPTKTNGKIGVYRKNLEKPDEILKY